MSVDEARNLAMLLAMAGDDIQEIKDVIERLIWASVESYE